MVVRAVIFDWGGTLTPWHGVDRDALWRTGVRAALPGRPGGVGRGGDRGGRVWHLAAVRDRRTAAPRLTISSRWPTWSVAMILIETYFGLWEPHTYTDPACGAAAALRCAQRSIRVGVLSNTVWPRSAARAGVPPRRGARPHRRGGLQQRDPVDQASPGGVPRRDGRGRGDRPRVVRLRRRPAVRRHLRAQRRHATVFIPHSNLPPRRHRPRRVITRLADLPPSSTSGERGRPGRHLSQKI